MQLVCCPLPETRIAGQQVSMAISLDIAWLLSRQFPENPTGASTESGEAPCLQTSDNRRPDDGSPSKVANILAHSPALLLWSVSQVELQLPLCHPDQLVDKVRQFAVSNACSRPVHCSSVSDRIEIRIARFVSKLQASSSKPVVASDSHCKLNQAFVALASQLTGIELARMAAWVGQRQIRDSFWLALSKFAGRSNPLTISLSELGGNVDSNDFSRQLQIEKLASLKRLAYGASHEINNPLANIASRAQTLLRDEKDGDRRKTLAKINQQAFRAFEMIADMMLFAHPPQLVVVDTDLKPILQKVVDELNDQAAEQNTEIVIHGAEPLRCPVDVVQFSVAILAVIQNAMESLGSGGKISVVAGREESGDFLTIDISDDGPGFKESELSHVFDPFFSGREAGRGLGFGLSKAWRIVEQHDGEITLSNLPHAGARVQIRIPYRVPTSGQVAVVQPIVQP